MKISKHARKQMRDRSIELWEVKRAWQYGKPENRTIYNYLVHPGKNKRYRYKGLIIIKTSNTLLSVWRSYK